MASALIELFKQLFQYGNYTLLTEDPTAFARVVLTGHPISAVNVLTCRVTNIDSIHYDPLMGHGRMPRN
jgi:hypothetical protein